VGIASSPVPPFIAAQIPQGSGVFRECPFLS
jgi:hypothetical protein